MDDERGRDIRSVGLSLTLNSEAKAEDGRLLIGGKRPLPGSIFTPEIASSSAAAPSVEPSLTLALPCDDYAPGRASRPQSVINSPFSSAGLVRENDAKCRISDDEEEEEEEEEEEDGGAAGRARKKLRLTKEQSALLEDRFREHTTLNTKQKQALAKQLKLRTRQVEVWFQNRRARTKLKKTELELEMLRKWCDTLREENRRLQRELQELIKSPHKLASARYMQLPAAAAAFAICPSCKKVAAAASSDDDGGAGKRRSVVAAPPPKPYFFINRFPRSGEC